MLKNKIVLILASYVLASCATMVRGTKQEISINTTPTGATIQFSNGQSCISPCKITAKRNESLSITISKEGYQTHTTTMVPTLSGGGVILGGLVNYGTGAVYDLQPNPYHVHLIEVLTPIAKAQK